MHPCRILAHLLAVSLCLLAAPLSAQDALYYETHVRPILKLHCFHCHGEDGVREGKLDVRLVRLLSQGGESGPAVTPGDPDHSLIWQRVSAGEMPPKGKGLSPAEQSVLKSWIEQGARTRRAEPESIDQASQWTEEERSYWAFQTPTQVPLPAVQHADQLITAIDAFLLAPLESQGLSFSAEADRATLLRRLSFDLLGLPPSPEEVIAFSSDHSPDAYERLVDRLLASPAYGERWARHWLDTAGYADSDGYTEEDDVRRWSFRYRDYVVNSLNQSKPIDQWIIEQLAGDELVGQPYENLDEVATERLIATGFLRTAPDGTNHGSVDAMVARNDVMAETIKIVSTSLLGMTVGCAQCHDHRYDPISQVDYYRFRAIFEPALDTKNWRAKNARLVSIMKPAERQLAQQVDAEVRYVDERKTAELDCIVDEIFGNELDKLPEEMRKSALVTRYTPADQRTPEQQQLMKDHPSLNVDRGSAYLYEPARLNDLNKRFDELRERVKASRPAEQDVACLNEVPGPAPVTNLFYRGDHNQPRQAVEPGMLSILPEASKIPVDDEYVPTTGRRLALARYLTTGVHPLTTRVLVNRVWMHHFGRGLVNTPGDFGALGERPTHPELLDWLAVELVQNNWDLKQLQKLMVTSRAYRQSSQKSEAMMAVDPDNRLLGRMSIRRLEAEAIRDAMIDVAGMRVSCMYGPPATVNPDDVGQVIVGSAVRDGNGIMVAQLKDDPEQYRRSLYVQVRRSMPLGMLEPFDLAALAPNCDRRSASTVTPQALLLMNNQVTIRLAERFAQRLSRQYGSDVRTQIIQANLLAFASQPTEETIAQATAFIQDQQQYFTDHAPKEKKPEDLTPADQALSLYCQALLSTNRFLYVE